MQIRIQASASDNVADHRNGRNSQVDTPIFPLTSNQQPATEYAMGYLLGLNSLWDEESWGSDSFMRSSLYKVQQGQLSYGQVSSIDSADWYSLELSYAGSYEIVISNDATNNYSTLNLWSTSFSGVRVELTDAYGAVISTLGSATGSGAFDGVLAFSYSGGYTSGDYYLKVTNLGFSDADYAVTLRNSYAGGGGASAINGTSGADTLVGTASGERIYGYAADDSLNGLGGNDTLDGGTGYDLATYYMAAGAVNVSLTTGLSSGADGIDTLISIEALEGSSFSDSLTGDSLANWLAGRSGNDTLNGGLGNDTMLGGAGNDIYVVDNTGDKVYETTTIGGSTNAGGTDTVRSSVSYTLGSFVEKLVLTGSGAINGTANSLANSLTGNAAANTLNGGLGNDTMLGGAGNDIYVVDNTGDKVYETTTIGGSTNAGGTDTVRSSVSYTLGSFVEKLVLTGSGAINGTGNSLANSLTGNAAANTLNGGLGNDTLSGGAGFDIFRFSSALSAMSNADTINGFTPVDDSIELENAVFTKLVVGRLAAGNFKANTTGKAADTNDYVVYETDTGKLSYDTDGSGAGAAILIATLVGAPMLTSADIFIT